MGQNTRGDAFGASRSFGSLAGITDYISGSVGGGRKSIDGCVSGGIGGSRSGSEGRVCGSLRSITNRIGGDRGENTGFFGSVCNGVGQI